MPGGRRKQSLEERLRAVRETPGSEGAHRSEPARDELPPVEALLVDQTTGDDAPVAEHAVEARAVESFVTTEVTPVAEVVTPAVEDEIVEDRDAPPRELHDDMSEFASALHTRVIEPADRATDRELSEVHEQLEALRTAASEGDTFLPGGASAATAEVSSRRARAMQKAANAQAAPPAEPVVVDVRPAPPVAILPPPVEAVVPAPVFEAPAPDPAEVVESPVANSFLDRFTTRGSRNAARRASDEAATNATEPAVEAGTGGAITGGAITGGAITGGAVTGGVIPAGAATDVKVAEKPVLDFSMPDPPDLQVPLLPDAPFEVPVSSDHFVEEPAVEAPGPEALATALPVVEELTSFPFVAEAVAAPAAIEVEWSPRTNSAPFGRIGTALIDRGLITSQQLDAALELQRATGKRIGDSLVDMGVISPFELVRVLADHMGVPFSDLRSKPPDPILATLLPEDVARRYDALPIARWNDQLVIAMANPTDLFALDDLQLVTRQSIIPAMALQDDLRTAIDRAYHVSQVETTLDAAATDYEQAPDTSATGVVEVDDAPVVRLVNALLDQAITDHASDLHVEPDSTRIAIRYRVDGVLHDASEVPLSLLRPLVSRLKILGNLDIAQTRLAQDGRFSLALHGRPVDVRVVTVPTAAGESVILRLLDPTRDAFDSSNLQLTPEEQARFLPPFHASQGAAFVTGPTGSGKTSTIYGVLSEINTRSKSIISVEDPVEYRLDGVKQMQINARAGLTFPTALRSVLRSDPDIVFIGEVRDSETARIAADAAITGHLVLSTLHATRAAAAPMRLVDMGVEPYLVAAAVTLVGAQRLARALCDACAEPLGESGYDALRDLGAPDSIIEGATVRKAVGCPACRHGFSGRLPLFEIMPVGDAISRLIMARASRAEIEQVAVEEGMDTMRVAALRRVAAGTLSIDEMMRVVS